MSGPIAQARKLVLRRLGPFLQSHWLFPTRSRASPHGGRHPLPGSLSCSQETGGISLDLAPSTSWTNEAGPWLLHSPPFSRSLFFLRLCLSDFLLLSDPLGLRISGDGHFLFIYTPALFHKGLRVGQATEFSLCSHLPEEQTVMLR